MTLDEFYPSGSIAAVVLHVCRYFVHDSDPVSADFTSFKIQKHYVVLIQCSFTLELWDNSLNVIICIS
jgi:hypothetical protein